MGGEFAVNTHTPDYQSSVSAALSADGGFVIAWASSPYCPPPPAPCNPSQDGEGSGIFARRYTPGGVAIGSDFRVNVGTLGEQTRPSIARLSGGRFAVIWNDVRQAQRLVGRLLDAAGAPLSAEFVVAGSGISISKSADVAALDNGAFVVVWEPGYPPLIKGRRFDASGTPLAAEFAVSTVPGAEPKATGGPGGSFVVVWTGVDVNGTDLGVLARRFDGSAQPTTPPQVVNTYSTGSQVNPDVGMDAAGNAFVVWRSGPPATDLRIAARRYDTLGLPRGPEFNIFTGTFSQVPAVAAAEGGAVLVTWEADFNGFTASTIYGRWFDSAGVGGPAFRIDVTTGNKLGHSVALAGASRALVAWTGMDASRSGIWARNYSGMQPAALAVDSIGPSANGVLEVGETVSVDPSWRNASSMAFTPFPGVAFSLRGPTGPSYSIPDATATYPAAAPGATVRCRDAADCHAVRIDNPGPRPAAHWDALLTEGVGTSHEWRLHVGDSFTDVPRSSPFYPFVERVFHRAVMPACAADRFCPTLGVARLEMAQFLLVAKDPALVPPACVPGSEMFADVPAYWDSCRWIEELARRAVVTGCGGGNYCPYGLVSREQLAVFLLRTLEGPSYVPPACGVPRFNDVPASSPFCRWIEELARRGVVVGCGGGAYCPLGLVSRQEMSVFLSVTFGLTLYGP